MQKNKTYTLYCDGNYFPRAKRSGYGGYIKDPNNNIICSYISEIKERELHNLFEFISVLHGIELAHRIGITRLKVFNDGKYTIRLFNNVRKQINALQSTQKGKILIYKRAEELCRLIPQIEFVHLLRKENLEADKLSRIYCKQHEESFLRLFKKELYLSKINFTKELPPKKGVFFSHPVLVEIIDKSNPYLIASKRNRIIRKKEKVELKHNYCFVQLSIQHDILEKQNIKINTEIFNSNFIKEGCLDFSFVAPEAEHPSIYLQALCKIFESSLIKDKKKLWIDIKINSDYYNFKDIFQQKKKINTHNWEQFKRLFSLLDGHERVFFNKFPKEFKKKLVISTQNRL